MGHRPAARPEEEHPDVTSECYALRAPLNSAGRDHLPEAVDDPPRPGDQQRPDGLIETLRRTKPRFDYCFIPNHRAGLVNLSSSTFSAYDDFLQVPLLRSQLRGSELLQAIRLYRQGYPDYMPLGEFFRRFNVLVPPDALPASLLTGLNSSTSTEKQAAEILLLQIDMERSSYRLGLGQVVHGLL
ncbi:hypothetical protein DAPPUDRAFT_118661 [Daphnia pulex]|uniref:Myosin motor domain-containing protein n=1 Tax=Daphnia pulex TaxID=6669 RepID=E9HWB1_DAPPU|nr:hypothetical protein DAPPUDRAFT_118661 [Daphnia pulex]|eukprot:EFX63969.1 hypothetical protein DAPPUDRAFT_118661 [Daphnia pulex]